MIEKPSYSTSKRSIWLNTMAAWLVIILLAIGAVTSEKSVEFATIALPSMVLLIAALNGIHRVTGSMDMKTMAEAPSAQEGGQT